MAREEEGPQTAEKVGSQAKGGGIAQAGQDV